MYQIKWLRITPKLWIELGFRGFPFHVLKLERHGMTSPCLLLQGDTTEHTRVSVGISYPRAPRSEAKLDWLSTFCGNIFTCHSIGSCVSNLTHYSVQLLKVELMSSKKGLNKPIAYTLICYEKSYFGENIMNVILLKISRLNIYFLKKCNK